VAAFFQGINEPTEGLLGQPIRSLLRSWGEDTSQIAGFSALLGLPWFFKPLYGLISDFVPLAGTRRKSYLVLMSGFSAISFLGIFLFPAPPGATWVWLAWLLIPAAAVAFADVPADALLVERGQSLGLTGRFQAIQWASLYASGIVAGLLGGELCERKLERWAFLVCGVGALLTLGAALACIREPERSSPRRSPQEALRLLGGAARSPLVVGVGGLLFLWNFNPFSNAVLHLHMTRGMGFSERFFGRLLSLSALASIAASLAYGTYCRRVPFGRLVHLSIALGVVSTLGYAFVTDQRSAILVTLAVGFTYMTATLIQLDLAARSCPIDVAGTVFALLMALENLAAALSTWLGGAFYEQGIERWGPRASFQVLVIVGSSFTAGCWLLLLALPPGFLNATERWDVTDSA
jgi:MFS family permease